MYQEWYGQQSKRWTGGRGFGRPIPLLPLWLGLLTALLPSLSLPASTEDIRSDRLAAIGIKLFRTTLAADLAIGEKGDAEGRLPLLLVYSDDPATAEALGEKLLRGGAIRKLPLQVEIVDAGGISRFDVQPPAGVFLSQPLPGQRLRKWVAFAKRHRIILYSPFRGHVEQGATAGQYISARLQPYVNLVTLEESGIELKEFFLNIAKTYR